MVSSEKLLQATLNRLNARLGEKLMISIDELTELLKKAPDKIRNEWELFQDEVMAEAERLEKESDEDISTTNKTDININPPQTVMVQEKIDQIRAKIEKLSSKLEANT